ncbi:fluoride efflux transporter CrcB [Mesobacillus harenae]|uniref:fluoride efflux transporter CrcB n=1 Tax=Mesobacillus harenae TaxID=2213203 RepID=UPI0015811962|nr:fluoride efflux transporter CrcB [Mesobacillus harenae]
MGILTLSLGGALGAVSRYLIGLALMKKYPKPPIPIAMLIVNVLGSFGLGLFFGLAYQTIPLGAYKHPLFLFLGIGFCGAFTTFSTFSMETIGLLRQRLYKKAILYFGVSIGGSLLTFLLGLQVGKVL